MHKITARGLKKNIERHAFVLDEISGLELSGVVQKDDIGFYLSINGPDSKYYIENGDEIKIIRRNSPVVDKYLVKLI
jgi:hypothetical protein